jgi:hypothetical protein
LNTAVSTVKTFLSYIGLEVEISKSKIVVIGAPQVDRVCIEGQSLPVRDKLRFLGVGICRTGDLVPWLDNYVDRLHAMWNKLGNYGFGASPIPFMTAFKIFI